MSLRPVIGADAGGTKLLAGVVQADLTVGHRVRRLWSGGDRAEVVETMVEAVAEALTAAPEANAVGFGIPALLDFEAGVAESSVHLPLEGFPFRDAMAERIGLPVHVDNDANLAVLAEQQAGAARGASHVVMLTPRTGIGSGIVVGGGGV